MANFYFKFNHFHKGVDIKTVKNAIYEMNPEDGFHKIIVKGHQQPCGCINIDITSPKVFWAFRGERKYPSPCITAEDAADLIEMTDSVTVVFKKKGNFILVITTYPGNGSPKEPSTATASEMEECIQFWSKHALIPDETVYPVNLDTSAYLLPAWALEKYIECGAI